MSQAIIPIHAQTAQTQATAPGEMPVHSPLSHAGDWGPLFTLFMPVSFAVVLGIVSWLSIISF